jgi:hypothetical protein
METVVNEKAVLDWLTRCGVEVPKRARRIVLDFQVGQLAKIYFDCFAESGLLEAGLDLSGAEIANVAMPDCRGE